MQGMHLVQYKRMGMESTYVTANELIKYLVLFTYLF